MKLCFAGTSGRKDMFHSNLSSLRFVLESHYYLRPWQAEQIKDIEHFMLDSGAFTFLNGKKKIDIEDYVEGYIEFIKKYNIQYFFELDIDNVVGYDEVRKLRSKIERKTKQRCIPVWHKSRGIEEFKRLCRKYDYIAIGGIVTKEISPHEHFLFNAFCDYAHDCGCKVHGLGFTPRDLADYKFDSVDSTSWVLSGAYGRLLHFEGGKLNYSKTKERLKRRDYDDHNLSQLMLFQRHLERVCVS